MGSTPIASTIVYGMIDSIVFQDLKDVPPPSEAKDPDGPTRYNGVLGMCEMEEAARIIVRRCQEAGTWCCRFYPDEFLADAATRNGWHLVLEGFCILIHNGQLRSGYPNGSFIVTPEFVSRVSKT
jgi:hypothetical protein